MGGEARRRNRSATVGCALCETRTELGACRPEISRSHRSRKSGPRSFPDGRVRGRNHQRSTSLDELACACGEGRPFPLAQGGGGEDRAEGSHADPNVTKPSPYPLPNPLLC